MIQHILSAHCRTNRTGCALAWAAAFTLCGHVSAEIEGELDELVVSATRLPVASSDTTAQIKVLDFQDLEERGVFDLRTGLNDVPGVLSLSTAGETGALGTILIRGTENSDSQVVVDGVRINDSNGDSSNQFFRGARLNTFGNIELLKGPQGSLYGGNAIGGVLFMETPRGSGDAETSLFAEGGSFDTLNTFASSSGSVDQFSWFLGGGYNGTHNDAANQDFDQNSMIMRLEWEQSDSLVVGATLRVLDQRFQEFATSTNHLDSLLGTFYVNAKLTKVWTANFTLGHYRQNYDLDFPGGFYFTDLDRTSFSTDHRVEVGEENALRFGTFVENNDFESSGLLGFGPFSVFDRSDIRYGGYLGWDWKPVSTLLVQATARWEDYADYGEEVTWNLGSAWEPVVGTRFSANVGRAFTPPTFLDLFGATATGPVGNPGLEAQESIGWDLGVEQGIGENHGISVTWFENSIENRIQSNPTPPVNLPGDTPTRGLELALDGALWETVGYRVSYTYLGASLQDQPDNTATTSLDWRPVEKLLLGVGATYVDTRSYGGTPLDDFLLLRLYGSYEVSENLSLHARVENLTDEEYELSNFFGTSIPGAGLGFFTGLTATF